MNCQITHPWLDTSRFPLVEIRYPEKVADSDLEAFLLLYETFLESFRGPYAAVVDFSAIFTATQSQRRIYALSERRIRDIAHRKCRGVAMIVDNSLMRGCIAAVYWMSKPNYPYKVFSTRRTAVQWAYGQLDDQRTQPSA